jgi:hypothetical protein
MDTVDLQLGIVGPGAGGEQLMNIFHDLIGNDPVLGWHNQLSDEPGLVAGYERQWRLNMSNMPLNGQAYVFPRTGVVLGNIHTYAGGGAQVRFGWNVPMDYGVARIRPATEHGVRIDPESKRSGWSFYLYLAADSRLVLRNIFLDGNTFKESHRVKKYPFVAFISTGWALSYKSFCFSYSHILTTKEFKKQPNAHQFASLVFSWMF